VYVDGTYRLNSGAGVGVDVACFDTLASQAERQAREGDGGAALVSLMQALEIYRGDLVGSNDIYAVMERERLRARYLTLLCRIADYAYQAADYEVCLSYALRLLTSDPCREDAHRLAMRCYVRLGERSQALRQYGLCQEMLQREFDACPEPSTTALYHQVRLEPSSI
jgi:DNA-binding SARP family transcriptional activator